MSMFQWGGGLHRLTQLYNDTKKSYEAAKVSNESISTGDDPELTKLKRQLQIQQDRLLAWGLHWADLEAQGQGKGEPQIDRKLDQAGLGELVASIMSEIKNLLDQSGRLQQSGRYEQMKGMRGFRPHQGPPSPGLLRKGWLDQEVSTGRVLLEKLTNCIDVLYSLTEPRSDETEEKGSRKKAKYSHEQIPNPSSELGEAALYIDIDRLEFLTDSAARAEPPPYDSSDGSASQVRTICINWDLKMLCLIDFLPKASTHFMLTDVQTMPIWKEQTETLNTSFISWSSHPRVLGSTMDPTGCLGIVYALSELHDQAPASQHKTLASTIAASHNHESALPPLEDRYRLAYNLCLAVLGYLVRNDQHHHINPHNILFVQKPETSSMRNGAPQIRQPYLLSPIQKLSSFDNVAESFSQKLYRHSTDDLSQASGSPAFDIYSLGVVLLEIGLWTPLTKLWKEKYDQAAFQERLQRVYTPKLASKCGKRYMRLVQTCLQASERLAYGGQATEAALYLLDVAKELRTCCAIDDDEGPPSLDLDYFRGLAEDLGDTKLSQSYPLLPIASRTGGEEQHSINLTEKPASKEEPVSRKRSASKATLALHKYPEMDIPQEHLDQWNTMLMPRLSKILQEALHDSPDACSVSLMMAGSSPETAKTTICVQCLDTGKVRDALRQRFKPKRGWALAVVKGAVRRSGKKKKSKRSGFRRDLKHPQKKLPEQHYQEYPICGASIGAFKNDEHLPPVSFGGMIMVDEEPYGMTVHHMLDDPSDDEYDEDEESDLPRRAAAPRNASSTSLDVTSDLVGLPSDDDLPNLGELNISDDDDELEEDSDSSTIVPDYCITDDEGNEFWFLEDSPPDLEEDEGFGSGSDTSSAAEDDEDDRISIGDKVGISPYGEDELRVTQPAIDDVDDDFFPNLEDKAEDHLDSHAFGFVHASSGIRRVLDNDLKHEVDWALIRVDDERLKTSNICTLQKAEQRMLKKAAPTNTSTQPKDCILTAVAPLKSLSGKRVNCRGRSSGFKTGRISQAMSLVKFHGRQTFSHSYCVEGGFGIAGDSGAWVYSPETGEICGHVLAYAKGSKSCYIAPMEILVEDIKKKLGAQRVWLPDGGAVEQPMATLSEQTKMGKDVEVTLREIGVGVDTPEETLSETKGKGKLDSVVKEKMVGNVGTVPRTVSGAAPG